MIATALIAAVDDGRHFSSGRALAAWIGLVPRQYETGGKSRLDGMARAFGLGHLLPHGRKSLKERISGAAHNLSGAESLRIDLARVALVNPDLVVVDTARLATDPDRALLINLLADYTSSTIVVVDRENNSDVPFDFVDIGLSTRTVCRSTSIIK